MLSTPLRSAPALVLLLAGSAHAASSDGPAPPPGMVFLESERVVVGFDEDAAKEIILQADGGMRSIWGETPPRPVKVEDFYLMTTEVTNEQFAEYVSASGSQPPEAWGEKAINEARLAFLGMQNEIREKAKAEGRPVPPKEVFVSDQWWRRNWKDSEWEVPKEVAELPVTEVNYDQAQAYARWAGLRLMSEQEFQRAVRGKTKNLYPWGEDWESEKAVCVENSKDRLWPVGSKPAGASPEGVLDLAGSVWEWTSSPYVPYERHKPETLKIKSELGTRTVDLTLDDWDEAKRITVGGSYKNDGLAARATTRRATATFNTTNALGFRCAASPTVCYDMARVVEHEDVSRAVRSDHEFDLSLTVAMDRWKWRKGEAGKRLKGYAVITDYDYLLFTPVAEIDSSNLTTLGKDTLRDGPLILGYLSTTLSMTEPALEPGTYVIGWRGEGKTQPKASNDDEDEESAPVDPYEGLEFDDSVENLIVMDSHGAPLAALPIRGLKHEKLQAGKLQVVEVPEDPRKELEAYEKIVISAAVPAGRRGFLFDLELKCAKGVASGDWRK